jgi:retron-type reverse transcriptase
MPHKTFSVEIDMNSAERKQVRYKRRMAKRIEKRRRFTAEYDDFSRITDPDNLYRAFRHARLGVGWKESVQRYEASWITNINTTRNKLIAGEDISSGFVEFTIRERGKERHIKSVHISERVVQKVLCDQVLTPILSRPLIYDNSASLKNKGVHFALRRLKAHLSRFYRKNGFSNRGYILSIDLSKFFDSIRHDVLIKNIQKYIHDKDVLILLKRFITVFGDNVSLGLGSQISQIGAIFYPNDIDHFIKEQLGIKYYARYMDDMYLIHKDRNYLKYCLDKIIERCLKIGLTINTKKTKITSLENGFVFLKGRYSMNEKGRIVCRPCRKSTERMRRKLFVFSRIVNRGGRISYRDIWDSYQSWRNTYKKRFSAYYRIGKMDGLYNRLFIFSYKE